MREGFAVLNPDESLSRGGRGGGGAVGRRLGGGVEGVSVDVGNRPSVAPVGVTEGQYRLRKGVLDLIVRGKETAE